MLSTESVANERVTDTLTQVARHFSFDTFVHFRSLAEFSASSDIPTTEWRTLVEAWPYDPATFLRDNRRGNCVDFACYTHQELGAIGLQASIVGKSPDEGFTPAQRSFMRYRHTSLVSGSPGERTMYEPGWKIPQAIALEPVGSFVDTGTWKFKTLAIDDERLVQQTVSPLGKQGERDFSLQALSSQETSQLTKNLLRIPRRMEMLTPMQEGVPHYIIGFDPRHGMLTSNTAELPGRFDPMDIPGDVNETLSDLFGFDVKEELVSCMGLYRTLPQDFWIK